MMHKILLITRREYLSRVKKRSFIVMTLLGPLLIVGFYGIIIYLSLHNTIGSKQRTIGVVDQSNLIFKELRNTELVKFISLGDQVPANPGIKVGLDEMLVIPPLDSSYNLKEVHLETKNQPGLATINFIENQIEEILDDLKFKKHNYDMQAIKSLKSEITVKTIKKTDKGTEESSSGAFTAAGVFGAVIIYMFIFIYGVQVMRGVIEEKTNRIVEVMISSVKPFELMMGKIIGIAMVGLTQFIIWVTLTTISFSLLTSYMASQTGKSQEDLRKIAVESRMPNMGQQDNSNAMSMVGDVNEALSSLNLPLIIGMFTFYFIAGYLFYGALFAAVGSAVDSETDTQQFMLPITLPLIFGLVLSTSSVANDPEGSLAMWLSIIPFTSPMAMMVRIPFFGHFNWEIALSMIIMVFSFILMVWIAGRIYRTGILLYGKKVTYKELAKWLFYRS